MPVLQVMGRDVVSSTLLQRDKLREHGIFWSLTFRHIAAVHELSSLLWNNTDRCFSPSCAVSIAFDVRAVCWMDRLKPLFEMDVTTVHEMKMMRQMLFMV